MKNISLIIGGKSAEALIAKIKDKFHIGDRGKSMMQDKSFTTLPKEEVVELAIITHRDLGFEESPTLRTFLDTIKKHPKYELCFGEEGARLCLVYPSVPKVEWIHIAREPILASDGYLCVFVVGHNSHRRWFDGIWCTPESTVTLDDLWAVRVRK